MTIKTAARYQLRLVREKDPEYSFSEKEQVKTPGQVARILCDSMELDTRSQEVFVVLSLDVHGHINGMIEISRGGLSQTQVEPRAIYQYALLQNASAIMLAHNHPSGIPDPSADDIRLTKNIQAAGQLLGIDVLDHIVIGDGPRMYWSMKEHGNI